MRGLVLEGGGAKGAYQAGAIKALNKRKIYFNGVAGTSIGAINAAFYASQKFNRLYKLWLKTDSKELFGLDSKIINNISHANFNKKDIKECLDIVTKTIKNKGVDTTNIRKILEKNVNENRIRRNKIDLGIVTFNISTMKPVYIYLDEIPKGKVVDYIIASSYLPFYKFEKIIDDNYYFDGGIVTNCPVEMFMNKNYDEIYAIKAWRSKLKYKAKKGTKVNIITPRENLGSIINFNGEIGEYRMNLGYYDTLKFLDNLDGKKYYFKYYSEEYYDRLFDNKMYKKILKEYTILSSVKSNKKFILNMIERICIKYKINRFKVYNLPFLLTKLKYIMSDKKDSKYYNFIKNIKIEFE